MKVSVIIPTLGRDNLLCRAINSVLAQTYRNIEIIVVDDGSDPPVTLQNLSIAAQNIKLVRMPRNQGACAARNAGMEICSGEYITFLDSDDEYRPQKIENQLKIFTNTSVENIGIVTCGHQRVRNGQVTSGWSPRYRGDVLERGLAGVQLGWGTPFLMVERRLISDLGIRFDERLKSKQDWDFFLQCCAKSNCDFTNERDVIVHDHEGPRVGNQFQRYVTMQLCEEKYQAIFRRKPRVHAKYLLTAAKHAIEANRYDIAFEILERTSQIPKLTCLNWSWSKTIDLLARKRITTKSLMFRLLCRLTFR